MVVSRLTVDNIPIKPCENIIYEESKNRAEYCVLVSYPDEELVENLAPGVFIRLLDGASVYHAGIVTYAAFTDDNTLEVRYINEGAR